MDNEAQLDPSLEDRYLQATEALNTYFESSRLEIENDLRRICSQPHYKGDITNFKEMATFACLRNKSFNFKMRNTASMYLYLDERALRYEHALEAYKTQQNFTTLNRLYREVYRAEHYLPVYVHRSKLEYAVRAGRFVVVEGEVGAGKSTQLPQYLADMDEFSESIIICTQPRRIAAQTLAKRVSQEFRAGAPQAANLVCYASSWSQISEQKPRICYLTETTFLSLLTSKHADSIRKKIGAVVVDEVQERTIHTDVILGLLRTSQVCSHVKVIASIAALHQLPVCRFLYTCPRIDINVDAFPPDIRYNEKDADESEDIVVVALRRIKRILDSLPLGDIICFLTSEYEVENAKQRLKQLNDPSVIALCMHGRLNPEEMEAAFEPTPAKMRKVVFATDVAESSLKIEGLRYVVDMGLCKTTVYDPKRNLHSLAVKPISQSSADRRTGRIGRAIEGVCFREYSKKQFELFEKENQPEIRLRSLDVPVAYWLSLGINPLQFAWMTAPDPTNIFQSFNTLRTQGAITSHTELFGLPSPPSKALTPLGQLIVLLQMDAAIVAGILYAKEQDVLQTGIILAAVAAYSDNILCGGGDEDNKARESHMKLVVPGGELVTYFRMYLHWCTIETKRERTQWCLDNSINNNTMSSIFENVQEMQKIIEGALPASPDQFEIAPADVPTELIQRVILCMNKDKLAMQLRPHAFLVFESGTRGIPAALHPSSLLPANYSQYADAHCFVYHNMLTTNQTYLTQLTPVTQDMLVSVCGRKHADLVQQWMGNNKLVQIIKYPISPGIQTELLGGFKLKRLINELQCHHFENSPEELTITVWAEKSEAPLIETRLDKELSDIKSDLLKQTSTVKYLGSNVSLLLGAGLNVVEVLTPERILFESMPDTMDKANFEKMLSLHLNPNIEEGNVESIVLKVIRSKYFKGAIVVFSSVHMADRVKLLLERCPEDLQKVCDDWDSAPSDRTPDPQLHKIDVVLALAPTVEGRAFIKDRDKAEAFYLASRCLLARQEWRTLPSLPTASKYEFIIDVEPEDDEQTIRSRYRIQGIPQPDRIELTRKPPTTFKPPRFDPLVAFPNMLEDLLATVGIPVPARLCRPKYNQSKFFFREMFRLEKHVDFPIQLLDTFEQALDGLIGYEVFEGTTSIHVHKIWFLRLTLPAELEEVREACLENILAAFKSESVYNYFKPSWLWFTNDLVYDCYSDDYDSLVKLQRLFTSKVRTPEISMVVSPKLGQTELGRFLISRDLRREFPHCLLQNSILHIWTDSKGTVDQCLKLIRYLEEVVETAQEGRYRMSPSQNAQIMQYFWAKRYNILHYSGNGNLGELIVWGRPGTLERTYSDLSSCFGIKKLEAMSDSQQSTNRNISAATSANDQLGPNNKLCALCGHALTEQEFTTLDICAHQFHNRCLRQYFEKEGGRNLIQCPRRCGLIPCHQIFELMGSHSYIKDKAAEFFFRFHCDPTSVGLEKHAPH